MPAGWPGYGSEFFVTELRLPVIGGLSVRSDVLCPSCWLTLEPAADDGLLEPPAPGEASVPVVAPFSENDTLLAMIRFLKFSGGRAAAPGLSWWMAKALASRRPAGASSQSAPPLLVPVPLHPRRERSRGYNQAALLARGVGERLGIEVDRSILARVRNTRPQSTLDDRERPDNMRGSFALSRPEGAAGRSIILVDDLVTTGETIRACAAALAAARPAAVTALSAGRSRRIRAASGA